jgi:hypothetical protein
MMGWGDMGQRCTAILMLGTVVLTGCGTEPGPRIPPRMLDSAMGVPAAEWELLVAEYLRPETAAVRRFEIRNRLGLDLLDQIEDSFRIDQQNNAAARHKALAAGWAPAVVGDIVAALLKPSVTLNIGSSPRKEPTAISAALLGEAYRDEELWGRIQESIRTTRIARREEIVRKLRRPDAEYTYQMMRWDLWDFWDAGNPAQALARVRAEVAQRKPDAPQDDDAPAASGTNGRTVRGSISYEGSPQGDVGLKVRWDSMRRP